MRWGQSSPWHSAGGACLLGAALLALLGWQGPRQIQQLLDAGIRRTVIWSVNSPEAVDERFRSNVGRGAPPDIINFNLFNITNVQDVRNGGKPRLAQVGPYAYQKTRIMVSAWWDGRGHVAVKEYTYYTFLPHLSMGRLDDVVTTVNIPLMGVIENIHASNAGHAASLLLDLLVAAVQGSSDPGVDRLFMRRTVEQLLWGYEDPLLTMLDHIMPPGTVLSTTFQLLHNMSSVEEALAKEPSIINTGELNITHIWQRESQEGWTESTCWPCGPEPVHGSDGLQFGPGVSRQDHLRVWTLEIVRSAVLVYQEDVEHLGINLLRFRPDPAQGQVDVCHDQLQYHGLINLTAPTALTPRGVPGSRVGPPIFASLPHFCACDERLAQALDGLSCNLTAHLTTVDIEPITGLTMRAAHRLMISTQLSAAAREHLEPRISTSTIVPVFWVDENSGLSQEHAHMFRSNVYRAQGAIRVLSIWPGVAAAVLFVVGILLVLHHTGIAGAGDQGPVRSHDLAPDFRQAVPAATADEGIEEPLLTQQSV